MPFEPLIGRVTLQDCSRNTICPLQLQRARGHVDAGDITFIGADRKNRCDEPAGAHGRTKAVSAADLLGRCPQPKRRSQSTSRLEVVNQDVNSGGPKEWSLRDRSVSGGSQGEWQLHTRELVPHDWVFRRS